MKAKFDSLNQENNQMKIKFDALNINLNNSKNSIKEYEEKISTDQNN